METMKRESTFQVCRTAKKEPIMKTALQYADLTSKYPNISSKQVRNLPVLAQESSLHNIQE